LADLLSGRVDFALDNMTTYAPLAKQGKVKALGLSGPNPSGFLPGVPALQSSGVPGYNMVLWYAVMGPKNMPPEIVSKLSEDIKIILAQPKVKQALEALGNDAMYMPSKDIESFIRNEAAKWGGIVKRAGVKPE
jgi:tripartite-type tricarboxylate transporter receptor subunit TctC